MVKEAFKTVKFNQESRTRIGQCDEIIREYQAQGLRMTLRQLYYQLVSRALIPNADRSYKNLSSLVSNARLAGLLDWDAIEDRGRQPRKAAEWDDPAQLMESALYAYRLPRWKTQSRHVELWVEKDALSSVLAPIANEFHVTLMVNKGYSSQSAMYESAERFRAQQRATLDTDNPLLLYMGDHDPSGEDMVRDVRDRLVMFGVDDLQVTKIALTMSQVRRYNPPPNPAKVTDPRAEAYIAEFGDSSWELDALPPDVLAALVREALEEVVDQPAMDSIKRLEEADKVALRKATKTIMKKRDA